VNEEQQEQHNLLQVTAVPENYINR